MNTYEKQLEAASDPLTMAAFRKLVHISPYATHYYISTGLVPSFRVGPSQWFIYIRKSDVLFFLRDREANPEKYRLPSKSSCACPRKIVWIRPDVDRFDYNVVSKKDIRAYYSSALQDYPDVLKFSDLMAITGYSDTTLQRWSYAGHYSGILNGRKIYYPKEEIIDFLASDYYNNIDRKSKTHYAHIQKFLKSLENQKVC